jgi:hypothetical protein
VKTFYLCFECERILIEAHQIVGVLEMLLQHGLLVKSEELAINYQISRTVWLDAYLLNIK